MQQAASHQKFHDLLMALNTLPGMSHPFVLHFLLAVDSQNLQSAKNSLASEWLLELQV